VNNYKDDYINYRIDKAKRSLEDAKLLAANYSWSNCINRLYYTCYYSVSALLLKNDLSAQTHAGIKTQFNLLFVKTGILPKEYGKLYANLMDLRQKGDYGDMFDFDREAVEPLLKPVEDFMNDIIALIK
jgi:uncharacterized protein (UPF0332 family)